MIFSCPLALDLEIQNEIKADTHQFYFSKSSKYSIDKYKIFQVLSSIEEEGGSGWIIPCDVGSK